ncbi:MAG: hypothetical protein N2246_09715 [Candidatus Sumerlaeia bacterium]|nr:hypothetical protein [Candidatus Sumerlaeia bacterium]
MKTINLLILIFVIISCLYVDGNQNVAGSPQIPAKPELSENQLEQKEDDQQTSPSLRASWKLLNDFRQITEQVRQLEREKITLLEKLEKQKREISGRRLFGDRWRKAEIEKIIAQLHNKIDEGKKLETRQQELLQQIVGNSEVKELIQQRKKILTARIEKYEAEPQKNRAKIEEAERERARLQRVENLIQTAEDYGIEEVLAVINLPQETIQFHQPDKPGTEQWTGKSRPPFSAGRLYRRLARMEEEIHFLRQQLDQLENQLKEIRRFVPSPEVEPGEIPSMPEKTIAPPLPPQNM